MTYSIYLFLLLVDLAEKTSDKLDYIIWIALIGMVSTLFGLGLKLLYKMNRTQSRHGEILSLISMSNMSKVELFEILIKKHCRHYPDDSDVLEPLLKSLKEVNRRVAQKMDSGGPDNLGNFTQD
jgi:hypothetical protein